MWNPVKYQYNGTPAWLMMSCTFGKHTLKTNRVLGLPKTEQDLEDLHRVVICFYTGFTWFFLLLVAVLLDLGNQAITLFLQVLPETTSFTKVIRSLQEGLHRSEANRPSISCDPLKIKIDVCFVERSGESVLC
jgi:hypothetical protein